MFTRRLFIVSILVVGVNEGQNNVADSQKTVVVKAGENATLPCQMPNTIKTVNWTRNNKIVHLYRSNGDYLVQQDKHFKGRTSLSKLSGNCSLMIKNTNQLDEGNYTCHVRDLSRTDKFNITLIVMKESDKGDQTGGDNSPINGSGNPTYPPPTDHTIRIIVAVFVALGFLL
ncbi:myelin-oligodendrocyte glycoprotein-like [Plectropomus leopardus]|uniref:myelin-oligodendrocyte glycoprotein-like n=1 Tax=Plectropomus leopardus TaxID=160734 RepID=UPI001C4CD09C|nr:myelin-oligodendrocyte glycoprotein-like [Plectropomus leopardus]XP_042339016.1 myelin-oligodendrocyte glycoprotein-like [Plectropomus leopardus]